MDSVLLFTRTNNYHYRIMGLLPDALSSVRRSLRHVCHFLVSNPPVLGMAMLENPQSVNNTTRARRDKQRDWLSLPQ
jgi:hypothetical protein